MPPPAILKRLGYTSTFFYAGQTSWMQIGDFAKFNGFDNAVGGDSMGGHYSEAEWGVRDAELVDFLLKTDFPPYSFNMVLSVSNHPPYDIDLKAEGCPRELKNDDEVRMYHMWYADREIGRFVRAITEKYPDSLVIITGDHPSRNFPPDASYAEKSAVPVIFTGKAVADAGLANRECSSAQHLDIIPTLVELARARRLRIQGVDFPARRPHNARSQPAVRRDRRRHLRARLARMPAQTRRLRAQIPRARILFCGVRAAQKIRKALIRRRPLRYRRYVKGKKFEFAKCAAYESGGIVSKTVIENGGGNVSLLRVRKGSGA